VTIGRSKERLPTGLRAVLRQIKREKESRKGENGGITTGKISIIREEERVRELKNPLQLARGDGTRYRDLGRF